MSTETSTHPDGFEHDHTPVDPEDKITPCTECPVILEWVGPDRDDFAPIDGLSLTVPLYEADPDRRD